jgi:histidyl-tRNA synthetase
MSEKKIKAIYGTKDMLPEDAPKWWKIVDTVYELANEHFHYAFIQTPIFEATELFAHGIGETNDMVTKEMYTFEDQGNRSLTLRPEGTAPVVRAYLEHSMGASQGLVKVWYLGPMFRQERPQAGRYRQFYQFGVEAIGLLDPALDAEVIYLNHKILLDLGLENLRVYVNSIGMPGDRHAHKRAFADFVAPNLEKFCKDCQRRFHTNPLRMFDCKEKTCQELLRDAPVILNYLSQENRDYFNKVQDHLRIWDIPFQVDKKLVRGLDYYTRTAWEVKSDKLGSQDSLSGGGRYDLLVEQLGGPPTPGIGFAAGIERIMLAMPSQNAAFEYRDGFFIANMNDKFEGKAFELASKIRGLGKVVDVAYSGKSIKVQLRQADRRHLRYALIFAEDEMARGRIILRDMKTSVQSEIDLREILDIKSTEQLEGLISSAK